MALDSNPNSLNSIESSNSNIRVYDKDDGTQIDRISDLPDSIQCHILSFLPTKEAVTASFLSTRWLGILWSSPNLKLDFDDDQMGIFQFLNLVDGVLSNCVIMNSALRALRFSCKQVYGDCILERWIYEAAGLNVRSLDLKVKIRDFAWFPECIGACTCLTTLTLDDFNLILGDSFCLPNLKLLNLKRMGLRNDTTVANLLSSCPVLEELIMVDCRVFSRILEICIPTLKRLRMEHCSFAYIGLTCKDILNYEIVLNTPALEELYYYDYNAASRYTVNELNNLRIAHLDVKYSDDQEEAEPKIDFESSVADLVMICSNARHLSLSVRSMKAAINFSPCLLTLCSNLKSLELDFICPSMWRLLLHLLDSAPNLISLGIELGIHGNKRCAICEADLGDRVPDCFNLNFQKCSILNFTGASQEFSFVEYFLKHAKYLQKMVINFGSKVKMEDQLLMKENLLTLPSCSKTCQVIFSIQVGETEAESFGT